MITHWLYTFRQCLITITSHRLSPFLYSSYQQVATTLQLYTPLFTTSAASSHDWLPVNSASKPNTLLTSGIAGALCTATSHAAASTDRPFVGSHVKRGVSRALRQEEEVKRKVTHRSLRQKLEVKRKVEKNLIQLVSMKHSSRQKAPQRLCSRRHKET